MPSKYSFGVVIADYSSQGLISIPNDRQIQYLRDDAQSRYTAPASRTRSQSNATKASGKDTIASSYRPTTTNNHVPQLALESPVDSKSRRVLIIDSDSDEERLDSRSRFPARPQKSRAPQQAIVAPASHIPRPSTAKSQDQAKQVRIQQPGEATPQLQPSHVVPESRRAATSPITRRHGGVKALIQARYDEELAAALEHERRESVDGDQPQQTTGVRAFYQAKRQREAGLRPRAEDHRPDNTNRLSLHEFLDSVPRTASKPKPQAREPVHVADKAAKASHGRDMSINEFLRMEPAPPEDGPAAITHGGRSPLVARLPKGIELGSRLEQRKSMDEEAAELNHAQSLPSSPRKRSRTPPRRLQPLSAQVDSEEDNPGPSHQPSMAFRAQKHRQKELSRSTAASSYQPSTGRSLNFDGFSDVDDDSYFAPGPVIDPAATANRPSTQRRRSHSLQSRGRSPRRPGSSAAQRPNSVLGSAGMRLNPVEGSRVLANRLGPGISPVSSPKHSLTKLSSVSSFEAESSTTVERPASHHAKLSTLSKPQPPSSTGSWHLPKLTPLDDQPEDFSNLFDAGDGQEAGNILIFTSDEEDGEDEEDDAEVDDLPTPQLQSLSEDVQIAPAHWGTISSGRHVDLSRKEADSMSMLSAVYPPDIGRYSSVGEAGGPLEMALAGMRHGGELGASYKPGKASFLRKAINPSEFLQRLGLRHSSNGERMGSVGGISSSRSGAQHQYLAGSTSH